MSDGPEPISREATAVDSLWTPTESYGLNLPFGPGQDDVPDAVENLAAELRRTAVRADDVVDIHHLSGDEGGLPLPGFTVTLRARAADDADATTRPGTTGGRESRFGGDPSRTMIFRLPRGKGQDSVPDLLEGLAAVLRASRVGADQVLGLTFVDGHDAEREPRPGLRVTLAADDDR